MISILSWMLCESPEGFKTPVWVLIVLVHLWVHVLTLHCDHEDLLALAQVGHQIRDSVNESGCWCILGNVSCLCSSHPQTRVWSLTETFGSGTTLATWCEYPSPHLFIRSFHL